MNFISRFHGSNISHVLHQEILRLSQLDLGELGKSRLFIVEDNIRQVLDRHRQKWRQFVLSNIFSEVEYISKRDTGQIEKPCEIIIKSAYDCHAFIDYQPCVEFMQLIDLIKDNVNANNPEQYYVLLSQRKAGDRYLIDSDTNLPLQDYLSSALCELNIPFKSCEFSSLTPKKQVEICGGAKIFIGAHGAGNTNLVFTPDQCHIMEFNFRKHWFCDPLCNQHFSGELAYNERCGGELTFKPYFHKADYSNLSRLLNKPYTELEIEKYEGVIRFIRKHRRRNPICRRQLYVDGKKLIGAIKEISPEYRRL